MKITYIHHSSFSVELDTCILLFDYYKGRLPKFPPNKKLYIFSSHHHHDHFSLSIFDIEDKHPNTTYILSSDILNTKSKNTIFVDPHQSISLDNLQIQTLQSTDLGVAFIVKADGKTIYHAGDLNWWHWEGENSAYENENAASMYKEQINKIEGTYFDVAFVPLDSRQDIYYYLGFDTFMNATNTKLVFPMHFWNDYTVIDRLLSSKHSSTYKDKVIRITKAFEIFEIQS